MCDGGQLYFRIAATPVLGVTSIAHRVVARAARVADIQVKIVVVPPNRLAGVINIAADQRRSLRRRGEWCRRVREVGLQEHGLTCRQPRAETT